MAARYLLVVNRCFEIANIIYPCLAPINYMKCKKNRADHLDYVETRDSPEDSTPAKKLVYPNGSNQANLWISSPVSSGNDSTFGYENDFGNASKTNSNSKTRKKRVVSANVANPSKTNNRYILNKWVNKPALSDEFRYFTAENDQMRKSQKDPIVFKGEGVRNQNIDQTQKGVRTKEHLMARTRDILNTHQGNN